MDTGQAVDKPDKAKQLQNSAFKRFGFAAALIGLLGFVPSYYKAATTGVLWSVSHDAPHTENDFLVPHFICMLFWLFGAFGQLASGGTSYKKTHRICGYVALSGLFIGMLGASGNIFKYDFADQGVAGMAAGGYTILLVLGATVNGAVGLGRAIQKRTKEHKDHMLMAIMWSLDPAVHRFAMWLIRWFANGHVDSDLLLTFGKLPANFILVTLFGTMLVRGQRVTCINVANVGMQFFLFVLGVAAGLAQGGESDLVRGWVIAGLCTLTLVVATLCIVWRSTSPQAPGAPEENACRNLAHA